MTEWYRTTAEEALQTLGTDAERGLDTKEARRLLSEYGPNELVERAAKSPWRMLLAQFTETMVVILLIAALVSGLLGKVTETIAILAIVLMFAVLGFVQEYRAERAMAALKKMAVPTVRVRREGQVREFPARELVRGDILLLEAGNVVPADVRFLEAVNLRIQEAALTGESEPVEKQSRPLDEPDLPLGDRRNMGYMGTMVTYGRGAGVVVETGMETELGMEPAEAGTMRRPPRSPQAGLLDRGTQRHILWVGLVIATITLTVGFFYYEPEDKTWQTMMFTTLAFTQIGHALGLRATVERSQGWHSIGAALRANPALAGFAALTILLQVAAVYVPFLDEFFEVVPLSATDFVLCVVLGAIVLGAVEIEKRLVQRRMARPAQLT